MFVSALAPKAHNEYAARYPIVDAAPWFKAATGVPVGRAMPAAVASAAFWTDVIGHHAQRNGLRAVVWDDTISLSYIFAEYLNSTTKVTQLLSGIFEALAANNATARVDMQSPTDAMLGLRFAALTVGRAALLANLNEEDSATVTFDGLKGATLWSVVHGKAGSWSTPFRKSVSADDSLVMEPLAVYLAFIAE